MPARLHAPRTRTGPTLPRTSPPLFQGIPSTLFLPLKTHPNFNLSAGAPLPSSPPSPTLAVALQSPCALPSPARTQPPRLRGPQAAPRPPRPAPNTHLSPKHVLGPSIPLFPSVLGTLFPSHKDKTQTYLGPARCSPAHTLSSFTHARSPRCPSAVAPGTPFPGTHATPTHATARTHPPRRRSAHPGPRPPRPSLTPPTPPPLPGNFPHQLKGIQPTHPSTPFSNKQSNEQTHTASQKPQQKTPHLNLSAAGTPLTALPQSPPARPGPQHSLQLSLPLCSGTTHKPLPAALAHSHTNPSGLLS